MPDLVAVGYHSAVEGTELHVVMCDLDTKRPTKDPRGFRQIMQRVADKYRLGRVYVFETRKGFHAMSPSAVTLETARRIERDFTGWGADPVHGWLMKKNNGTVLRLTEKPGEEGGPRYVCSFATRHPFPRPYSLAHVELVRAFFGDMPPPPGDAIPSMIVRLERYHTPDAPKKETKP